MLHSQILALENLVQNFGGLCFETVSVSLFKPLAEAVEHFDLLGILEFHHGEQLDSLESTLLPPVLDLGESASKLEEAVF